MSRSWQLQPDQLEIQHRLQPPSIHKAGDFIVYRDGKLECRHDFGKTNGAAAYFPHYALHYPDAEHSLEKVTLVCSIFCRRRNVNLNWIATRAGLMISPT
ncbi:hypothetical protein GQ600_19361 [Phytophthora cactorum]|nr:hypothetical protein GQ600_19361 [Phytophthora cactorum]